jgi:hypothetical protein
MKRTRSMLAARAEKRAAAWRSRHAALFTDDLEEQLVASIESIDGRSVIRQEDGAPLMYIEELSPLEVLAILRARAES